MLGNEVFAAKATNSTYGITLEEDYIRCGKCTNKNGGIRTFHDVTKMEIMPSGQPSNGKLVNCDSAYSSEVDISNSDGYEMSKCKLTKTKASHAWSNGKCTTCQISNSNHTWSASTGKCTVCGLGCSHSFQSGICTTCGSTCAHPDADEGSHNAICSVCEKEIITKELHSGGTATCTEKAKCENCGEAYGALDPNNHSKEAEWSKTETTHEKKYPCCETVVVEKEAHEFENGVCKECEYEERKEEPTAVVRVAGKGRYDTCIKVAEELKKVLAVSKFDTAIIATGKDYADALSGSYLAKVKNAPILLTDGGEKVNAALFEYIRENVKVNAQLYILGGYAAVPEVIEKTTIKNLQKGRLKFQESIPILGCSL